MTHFKTPLLMMSLACFWAQSALSRPLVEKTDRFEIDWTNMKLRFFGEAQVGDSYKSAEQKAWQDGLNYVGNELKELRDKYVGSPDGSHRQVEKQAYQEVTASTYSINTTYFSNGKIRVHLENDLTKALKPGDVPFKALKPEKTPTKNSGLVIKVRGKMRPNPTYRVVNDQGQTVFEAMDVAKEAFEQRFMGSWFEKPEMSEMRSAVGPSPVVVEGEVGGDGIIRVNHAQWYSSLAGNGNLLQSSKVAIALF